MSHDDAVGILLTCPRSSAELQTDAVAPSACLFHALSEREAHARTGARLQRPTRSVHTQRSREGNYEKRGALISVSVPLDV